MYKAKHKSINKNIAQIYTEKQLLSPKLMKYES